MGVWVAAFLLTFLAGLWSVSYFSRRSMVARKGSLGLPPGPRGLPLIGHLHMLGALPHRNLQKLAKKHGPIMFIKLGMVPTIVISSPEWAELVLKTHDLVFASRPKFQIAAVPSSYSEKNLVFAPYGPYWRNVRKLCVVHLLNSSKIEFFKPMRREYVANFVDSMKHEAKSGCVIDISAKVGSLIEDMAHQMIFGINNDKLDFRASIQEAMRLVGIFNIADYIPFLAPFDLQGLIRRIKVVEKVLTAFLEKMIEERKRDSQEIEGQYRDFIDVMLSLGESSEVQIDRGGITSILTDILTAAMDTTATAIEWALAEVLKHPRVMKLVQQELETVFGLNRMVEETDLAKLDYLKMVIKESLRIHPVGPFLIPHESMKDITINGYFIPKKSRVLVNTWAIGRDPDVWSKNAEEFYPERFLDTKIDIQGHDFELLPFGSGRRRCPGSALAMILIQLVLAQLLHCFNLELPFGMSPDDLDMTEKFGLTLPRANHLKASASYRLNIDI